MIADDTERQRCGHRWPDAHNGWGHECRQRAEHGIALDHICSCGALLSPTRDTSNDTGVELAEDDMVWIAAWCIKTRPDVALRLAAHIVRLVDHEGDVFETLLENVRHDA